MTHLPTVTVVAVTTKDYGPTIEAIHKTLKHIDPYDVFYFSDNAFHDPTGVIKHFRIDRFKSVEDYNHFIFKLLGNYIDSEHVLVIQHDGYVVDGKAWRDEFLDYDYIGAPWTYTDGRNVGNGGFSLRSLKLQKVLQSEEFEFYSPEDEKIARYYRQTLERKYGIKYAPDAVAHKFSFEMHKPLQPTFGFHNYFHTPYQEPVILRRSGAMGDVIMMEPLMEHFFNQGKRVILDMPVHYFNLFKGHFYQIEHLATLSEDTSSYRTINLDMAYEVKPKQLALKSYYEICDIPDGFIRNSRLNFRQPKEKRMFEKYVVIHTDDTDHPHRNVHGVNWDEVAVSIERLGYPVFRVGVGNGTGGLKINTFSENMLAYIVGNADYFIGPDSGCGQIAVACGVPSVLFFGSVNPKLRYADLSNIKVMQKHCPNNIDGCYHDLVSVKGKDCEVDIKQPPCIAWETKDVIFDVNQFIKHG